MNKGTVEQIGSPKEIYKTPKNEFVADFIGRVNIIKEDDKLVFIRPESVTITDEDTGYKGQIIQKQYMGPYTIYFVKIGDDIIQGDILNTVDRDWKIDDSVNIKFIETINKAI